MDIVFTKDEFLSLLEQNQQKYYVQYNKLLTDIVAEIADHINSSKSEDFREATSYYRTLDLDKVLEHVCKTHDRDEYPNDIECDLMLSHHHMNTSLLRRVLTALQRRYPFLFLYITTNAGGTSLTYSIDAAKYKESKYNYIIF